MDQRSINRFFAWAGAAAVLALAIGAFGIRRRAEARWAEMVAWVESAERGWHARDFRRPVLHGETVAGRAFDHYAVAEQIAKSLQSDHEILRRLRRRTPGQPGVKISEQEVAALIERWAPAITAMRAGAHCDDARRPTVFAEGFNAKIANLLDARELTNVVVLQAWELLELGRDIEAVELCLDAATFGADYVGSPLLIEQMIGLALVAIPTSEAWTDEQLAELDSPALELLSRGLERLDAMLPADPSLQGEALLMASGMLQGGPISNPYQLGLWDTWRHAFSSRWITADAVLEFKRTVDHLQRTAGAPWSQRQRGVAALQAAVEASTNPIVRASCPNLLAAGKNLRHCVTLLRLLRMNVDVRLGRAPTPLDDPLGDGLLTITTQADGRLTFHSDEARARNNLQRELTAPSAPR